MPSDFLLVAPEETEGDLRGRNLALMMAYTVYKHGICPHCGYPREVCGNEERFEVQTRFCYAKGAVDEATASEVKPEPGELKVPVYQPPVQL